MPEIILLTGATEFPFLADLLRPHAGNCTIKHAETGRQLEILAKHNTEKRRRLIAFCTAVIVPKTILRCFEADCYNYHPAPPNYPGYRPAAFAIYNKEATFGATVHRMTEVVDAGEIIGTDSFQIDPDWDYTALSMHAYSAAARLFAQLAPQLADLEASLPGIDIKWGSRTYTRADQEEMRRITSEITEDELVLRLQAFGSLYCPRTKAAP